jgi:hypothetical protein
MKPLQLQEERRLSHFARYFLFDASSSPISHPRARQMSWVSAARTTSLLSPVQQSMRHSKMINFLPGYAFSPASLSTVPKAFRQAMPLCREINMTPNIGLSGSITHPEDPFSRKLEVTRNSCQEPLSTKSRVE